MTDQAAPTRHLSVAYVIMIAVGMVVGAGIFKSPALVADNAGTAWAIYGVWLVGGLISLIGALCYSELATAYPSAGGDYHFLTKAYGREFGFAFAWARFSVINTGSIALLGFVIGDYLNLVWDLGPHGPALYALISVVVMTLFNLRGTSGGATADYAITSLEVLGLLALTAASAWLIMSGTPPLTSGAGAAPSPAGVGYALVFVLLAFGGWSEMATLSAEVKNPRRGMLQALVGAVVIITLLYLLANWALIRGLGVEGLAQSKAPAADLMARAFGPHAGVVLAIAVAAAAITSINGTIIVGARTTFAAARERAGLDWIGQWDGRRDSPAHAILAQGAVSVVLVGLGAVYQGFETLVDYTAPVYWAFLTASGLAVIVLRQRFKDHARPFEVPLYPLLPLVFSASSALMLWSSLNYVKQGALFGLAVVVIGLAIGRLTKPKL
ncbi:serine/threonine exchanger SteT [Candidatus Phycosocius bacilliformis]|uniref:Serine/threonine exchanger SteT n=1 Tax=Candidatus Phycosocius bacilliformis TaxID=1445552 RepID=A0A2P2E9Y8_9PROT|nr:APC family permease [Candidatus Phycosocius bacilliformis]GBF57872.1 serine/threonine exchanger SteT [Candidatus Phycosocius bacilliformis]